MSFTADEFRKITGVSRDADAATLEGRLGTVVAHSVKADIAAALIVRMLVVEHGWKVKEGAARVGWSDSHAGLMGKRGAILFETGPEQATLVWQATKAFPSETLTAIVEDLRGMTSNADRTAYVIRLGMECEMSARLGENSTNERVKAMTDAAMADGHRTPLAARQAAAGLAQRLSIPLPPKKKRETPKGAAGGTGADVPAFDAALRGVIAAVAQARDGVDADHPLEVTAAQAALIDEAIAALVAMSEDARVLATA